MQQGTGYGDALALSLAQAASGLSAKRFEPFREFKDKARFRGFQGLAQFFFASSRIRKEQIIPYGPAHQTVALRNVAEVSAGAASGFAGRA